MRYLLCVLMCCVMCFGFANVTNAQCDKGVCPLPPFVARGVVIVETPVCTVVAKTESVLKKIICPIKKIVRPIKTIREARKVRGPWKTRCGRRGPVRLLRRILSWRPLRSKK